MNPKKNRLTVLIADDDTAARESLENILARKYPEILFYSAGDGKTALEYFREYQPDIVISDVIMPEMNGIKMVREIKAINAVTKLIMLTGLSDPADFDELALAGITIEQTILKPVDLGKLFAALDQCIAGIELITKDGI